MYVCVYIPVSYTHLDVYKRQRIDTSQSIEPLWTHIFSPIITPSVQKY